MVSQVEIASDPGAQTRITLSFAAAAPLFLITRNGDVRDTVALSDAAVGSGVSIPPVDTADLIGGLAFTQSGGDLILTVSAAKAIRIDPGPAGPQSIVFIVAPMATSPQTTAAAPPAPVADGGAMGDVYEIVPLKYADVSEVAGLLVKGQDVKPNDNFTPQEPSFGSGSMGNSFGGGSGQGQPAMQQGVAGPSPGASGDTVGAIGHLVDDTVGVDRRLNAIILRGRPDRIALLKGQIAKLDVPVNSVVFETVFVELTKTGAKDVGLDLTNGASEVAAISYQTPVASGQPAAAGLTLQAAIYAQIQKGEGRIISKPRIAARSGETAKIITGDALPILTSIAVPGLDAVSQQVQYVNVGVTLQIAPRVSDDGSITSHVFAEVSSVTGYSQGYPTISQREASTSATVRDGQSFVIGGLTQDNSLSTQSRLPLIGAIPLLGALLGDETSTQSKTDLYIVVTPHIVKGPDAAAAALARTD